MDLVEAQPTRAVNLRGQLMEPSQRFVVSTLHRRAWYTRLTVHIQGGAVRLPDGTLAGSVLTMEKALRNVHSVTGRSMAEIRVLSSLNAARAIGASSQKGSLEVGKDADLVLLDEDFYANVTVVKGEIVFST